MYEMKTRHESAYHQIHPGGEVGWKRCKDLKMKPFSLFYFPDDEIDPLECLQPSVGWPSFLIEPDDGNQTIFKLRESSLISFSTIFQNLEEL